MKKNLRVVQINGLRGIFIILFVVTCLIAGFIAFPALLIMHTWNYLATTTSSFPSIEIGGGLLLCAIIIFSVFVFNKKKFIVSFNSQRELTDDEVKEVVSKIKAQTFATQILQSKDLKIKEIDEIKEVHTETKEN